MFTIKTTQSVEGTATDYAEAARIAQSIANERGATVVAEMFGGTRFYFYPQI